MLPASIRRRVWELLRHHLVVHADSARIRIGKRGLSARSMHFTACFFPSIFGKIDRFNLLLFRGRAGC